MPCVSRNLIQDKSGQVKKAFLRFTFLPEISTHLLGLEFLCELSYWRWAAGAAEPHGLDAAAAGRPAPLPAPTRHAQSALAVRF